MARQPRYKRVFHECYAWTNETPMSLFDEHNIRFQIYSSHGQFIDGSVFPITVDGKKR